ncbi:MAG: general secretion pathway protein GspK [Gemmatimonadales bacterium]
MRDRRGFALLAALGLLVAMSTVGLALALRLRVSRLGAANAVEHAQALAAAEGGVAELRARLTDRRRGPDRWDRILDQPIDTIAFAGARAAITLRDLGARLNLNRASEDELRRLFTALRIDAGEADRLAQTIADWRDTDGFRRARGGELDEYVKRGSLERPRNGDFDHLSELSTVLGMTPERYTQLRTFLTVHGTGRLNLNAAERPVLLALSGMTEQAVKVLSDRRAARRPVRTLSELQTLLPSGARDVLLPRIPELEARVVFETRELEVVSDAQLPGSPVRARVTVLLARAGDEAVVTWRQIE